MKQLGIPHKEMCWDLQEANEMKIELRIWILQGERDQQTQFNSPLNLTWAIKFVLSDCDSGGPLLITFQNKQTKFIQTRHFIHFLLVWLTIAALVWLNWLTWIKSNVHCIGELQYYDLCTWSLICIIQWNSFLTGLDKMHQMRFNYNICCDNPISSRFHGQALPTCPGASCALQCVAWRSCQYLLDLLNLGRVQNFFGNVWSFA